jgi:hypothetical protein
MLMLENSLLRIVGSALGFVAITSTVIAGRQQQVSHLRSPAYSAHAVAIGEGEDELKESVSPDGKVRVSVASLDDDAEDFPTQITVETDRRRFTSTFRFGLNTELLWSPDSKAFSITGSCCGANEQYETDVFIVRENGLNKIELTRPIERAFGHPVRCWWREPPNVGAVKWIVPSKQLLVAAEIVYHSNCDSYGTFRGYVADLEGPHVTAVINQLQVKKQYGGDLGSELLGSRDECVRDPKSCWVQANH